jgi:hypothetical protein
MAESPFISMSAAEEQYGVSLPHTTTTISMVPSGPEWIARQSQQEIMSLSWGWSADGSTSSTTGVSREQVLALLKRVAFVKKGILGFVFVAAFTLLVWILDDSRNTVSFLSITLIVSLLLYICAEIYRRILISQLSDMFSRGVLLGGKQHTTTNNNHSSSMMSNNRQGRWRRSGLRITKRYEKGKEEQHIQVTLQNHVPWTPRQTPEEILSVEGWTDEDLTVLGPLLQKQKVGSYFLNGALLAFLVYIYLPIMFPRVHEWEYGADRSEAVLWAMFGIQTMLTIGILYGIYWIRTLSGPRVEQMFVRRFMMQPVVSGPPQVVC